MFKKFTGEPNGDWSTHNQKQQATAVNAFAPLPNKKCRIGFVGSRGVGKTSLIMSLLGKYQATDKYNPTYGKNIYNLVVDHQGEKVLLEIHDFQGLDNLELRPDILNNIDSWVMVFSSSQPTSLPAVFEFKTVSSRFGSAPNKYMLVGTFGDVVPTPSAKVQSFAQSQGVIWLEHSCRTNDPQILQNNLKLLI